MPVRDAAPALASVHVQPVFNVPVGFFVVHVLTEIPTEWFCLVRAAVDVFPDFTGIFRPAQAGTKIFVVFFIIRNSEFVL